MAKRNAAKTKIGRRINLVSWHERLPGFSCYRQQERTRAKAVFFRGRGAVWALLSLATLIRCRVAQRMARVAEGAFALGKARIRTCKVQAGLNEMEGFQADAYLLARID
jgi:hypothetical protein